MPRYIVQNTHVRYKDKLHAPGTTVTMSEEDASHLVASEPPSLVLTDAAVAADGSASGDDKDTKNKGKKANS